MSKIIKFACVAFLLCAPSFAQEVKWYYTKSMPTAASGQSFIPYVWTQATTANVCPAGGAGGSGGSAVAYCITYDGISWTSIGSSPLHAVNIAISGSPIATGTANVSLPATANFTCTINKAQVTGNVSGSITVDIWKANAAIPTSGNKISATAPVTLSSAQLNQNSALTGWTTSVVPGDVFWASIATVDGVLTGALVQIWCQ